jgi:hypothetical protein
MHKSTFTKSVMASVIAASLVVTPMTASAHGFHGGGGRDFGFFALGAALVGATAAIVTAPFYAVNAMASQPYYAQAPQPYYAQAPQPVAYAPQPQYYAPAPPTYYYPAPQPAYYYAPAYYR